MCRAVTCTQCGKTTWAGCGEHIDSVKRTVPAGQWCGGHQGGGSATSPAAPSGGLFGRLFGKVGS